MNAAKTDKAAGGAGRPAAPFFVVPAAALVIAAFIAVPWLWQGWVACEWLGVAAALELARRTRGWRRAWATAAWSSAAIVAAFHWAPLLLAENFGTSAAVGVAIFAPFALWDAVRLGIPFWLGARLTPADRSPWLLTGLLSVVLESVVPNIFPFRLGYVQIPWAWTIQASDLFGPAWPTFMLFAFAGAITTAARAGWDAIQTRNAAVLPRRLLASPAVWLCAANAVYSVAAMHYWTARVADAPALRVALVQVDPSFHESTEQLRRLSGTVCRNVDLVCWPESAGGTYDLALDQLSDDLRINAHSREPERGLRPWPNPACPLLLGGKTYVGNRDKPTQFFQVAFLLDRGERITGRYLKRYLMPFGEYIPGAGWFPWINTLLHVDEPFSAGDEATVLESDCGARIGIMLCYEDMVPGAARSDVQRGANLLVTLSNGSAFPNPLTLAQHRLLAQLRAVECRKTFLRCTATGETCVISPCGRIEDGLAPLTQGVLCARVPLLDGQTLYCRWGDVFPAACFAAVAVVILRRRWLRCTPAA